MAVGEKLSSVRVVQLVATYADYTVLPVLPYDGIVTPLDFYDPLVTWSVMSTLPFGRNVFWTGVFNWLAPKPVTPN